MGLVGKKVESSDTQFWEIITHSQRFTISKSSKNNKIRKIKNS